MSRFFSRLLNSPPFPLDTSLFLSLIEEFSVCSNLLGDPENGFLQSALLQFALPHDNDAPTFRFQFPPHLLIPRLIPAHLSRPELRVGLGNCIILAPFVSMPEASMDENDRPVSRQDDIRAPRKPLVVYSISEPQPPEGITQTQLRLGGGGVDLRHDVVSLRGG